MTTAINEKNVLRDSRRNGAMLIMVAFVLVILFIAAAFAIDIAYMHSTRAELRTATDAAARAAAEALNRFQDETEAYNAAVSLAAANHVGGKPIELGPDDVVFGSQTAGPDGKFQFVEGGKPTTAIQIVGRRTSDSLSGSVPLFFGPLFGVTDFQPIQHATSCRLDRDIALVLDVSGSMNGFGKFPALQNAVKVFLDELVKMPMDEYVSLSVYSTSARKLVNITTNFDSIQTAFNNESPNGRTAIGMGLELGIDSVLNDPLSRPIAFKEVLLMTDGKHNTGISPDKVAPDAAAAGVTVHAITFGSDANQDLMKEVADATGGIFLHADTDQQLIEVFRTIALQIPVVLIE